MGICPNCGSWIDEGDICHGCGGSSIYNPSDDEDEQYEPFGKNQIDEYSKKAWNLYLDNKYDDALHYINLALDLNRYHTNNWNTKAIILEYMERYEESEKCYDKSLNLFRQRLVCDNKARMLLKWARHLLIDARKMPNGLAKLEESLEINRKAINARPQDSEENIDRFLSQKHRIESAIEYEKEYHKNVETLKTYDKSELFTIAGRKHYKINTQLTPGMSLKLVKEPDNKLDHDAIAGYVEDEKAGYVANSDYTKNELTSSASELQDKIQDIAQGKYLIYLLKLTNLEYPNIEFHIGRILKWILTGSWLFFIR